jgi:hypothetical protein
VPSAIQEAAAATGISVHTLRFRVRDKGLSLAEAIAYQSAPGVRNGDVTWPLDHEQRERAAVLRRWPRPPGSPA